MKDEHGCERLDIYVIVFIFSFAIGVWWGFSRARDKIDFLERQIGGWDERHKRIFRKS